MGLVAMLNTACNEDFKDWNDPQAWDQEDAVVIPGFAASAVGTIDLNALADDDTVSVFTLPETALPEGYELADARIVANPAEINMVSNTKLECLTDGKLAQAKAPLQAMVQNTYGLRPVERKFTAQVLVDAKKDGQAVLINAGIIDLVVIPEAPVIEEAYYITGNCNGWDNSNIDYELSNGGADPYENPEFTCMVPAETITASNFEFKVTPKSGIGGDWSKCLCADSENEGKFVGNNAGANFSVPADPTAKFYKVTFNMLTFTWSVQALAFGDYIYEIGSNTSWKSVIPMKHTNGQGEYVGYAYLDGEFKFKPNGEKDNWTGDWGQDPTGAAGTLVVDGEENCKVDHAAFYKMTVDLSKMTWDLVEITSIGIIGDAVNGDTSWGTEYDLTYNATDKCWEITTDLKAGQMKFRANHDWGINWGGTVNSLSHNGDNLVIAADGNYTIKLYPICDGKSYCTITKN